MNELKWNGIEWNEMNECLNEWMKEWNELNWTEMKWNEMEPKEMEPNEMKWNELEWIKKIYVINEWMNE